MSDYEPLQHKPKPQQTAPRADTVAVKPKRPVPPPDYRMLHHGFDSRVPLIQQGHKSTINGTAAEVLAHTSSTPVAGIFDWDVMPAEMPPWWTALPRTNTPVGPEIDAGTALLIDRALFMVTGYRMYCFFTIQHRDALLEWNAVARHEASPDPKRLDDLERLLRYTRFMQLTLKELSGRVLEESR